MADNNNYGRRSTNRNNNNGGNINGKYSMSYYGKNYELIDIKNLQKANAILVESIAKQREFIKEQQKRIDNGEKLNRQQEIYLQSAREAVKVEQERADKNYKVIDAWNRNIRSTLKNNPNKNDVLSEIIQTANSRNTQSNYQNMPKNIADIFNTVISNRLNANQLKETEKVYEKVSDSVVRKYKRQGADFSDAKTMNRMNQEIQEQTVAEMGDITTKYGRATTVLSVATEVFKEAVNTWVSVFKTGLGNQTKAFENTFEPISVRNGTTRGQYYAAQSELAGVGKHRLSDLGLNDNIKSSEIQNMWAKMAENGVKIDMSTEQSRADLTAKAIDLVVTNHIVPYLDTNSQSVQQLNARLGDNFIKQIRGINQANLEIAGNSYMTGDILNSLLEQVQPMSDKALEDLAKGSTELTAYANMLMAPVEEGGQGLSYSQANAIIQKIYKSQRYGNQMLKSDNIQDNLIMIESLVNGINPNDLNQLNDMGGVVTGVNQWISSTVPGYNSAMGSLLTNEIGQAFGQTYEDTWMGLKLNENGYNSLEGVNKTNFSEADIDRWANGKYNDFRNNKNQTNQTLQDITVENLANELAVGEEWMGHWTDVIVKAIQSVGAILLTKVVGGAIGKMAGSLLGSDAGTVLSGTALGSALGVTAAVTLPIAIAASVGKLSEYFDKKDIQKEGEEWALNNYGEPGSNNALYTNLMGEIGHSENNNRNGGALWSSFAYMWNGTFGRIGGGTHDTKNYLNMLQNESDIYSKMGNDGGEASQMLKLAYYVAADRAGQLGELGYNNADLKESLQLFGYDTHDKLVNFLNTYIPLLVDSGYMPKTSNGTQMTKDMVLNDKWLKDNYFRQGLDYVPYDDYRAVLHEGEAVLTASTASELRNLIDEYRNTAKQSVQFDVIIQNQTNALVNKMGEIIAVMQNNRPMFPTTATNRGNEILNYSMTKMVSTRDFSQ